jgi:hypothetical protein
MVTGPPVHQTWIVEVFIMEIVQTFFTLTHKTHLHQPTISGNVKFQLTIPGWDFKDTPCASDQKQRQHH